MTLIQKIAHCIMYIDNYPITIQKRQCAHFNWGPLKFNKQEWLLNLNIHYDKVCRVIILNYLVNCFFQEMNF